MSEHRVLTAEGQLTRELTASERSLLPTLFEHMLRLRLLDEQMMGLQRQGRIGFYGPAIGQEAVVVAAALALEPDEWVFPALREGGVMLLRGYPLERYLGQLFGNALDPQLGRQMPSHMASRSVHQVSWSSSIGTQLPHAVGAAWALKRKKLASAVLAFMGEGATSTGDFHSALNFAERFQLPVVFVCQNNGYALSVPAAAQTASLSFAAKAVAYGMASARVDGNDVLAVHEILKLGLVRARTQSRPVLIECCTYRLGPHSSSDDPSRYRADPEVAAARLTDPILRVQRWLEAHGDGPVERAQIEARFAMELSLATARAERAPLPALTSLFDDVYARLPWHLLEQRAALVGGR